MAAKAAASSEKHTIPDYLVTIANNFCTRAAELEMKGRARDKAALEFFLGAAAGLLAAGNTIAGNHVLRVAAMLITTRGYAEVQAIANR